MSYSPFLVLHDGRSMLTITRRVLSLEVKVGRLLLFLIGRLLRLMTVDPKRKVLDVRELNLLVRHIRVKGEQGCFWLLLTVHLNI